MEKLIPFLIFVRVLGSYFLPDLKKTLLTFIILTYFVQTQLWIQYHLSKVK